jgi:hypothetical protein
VNKCVRVWALLRSMVRCKKYSFYVQYIVDSGTPLIQELGAVMCGVVTDGHKASNSFFKTPPSEKVQVKAKPSEYLSSSSSSSSPLSSLSSL